MFPASGSPCLSVYLNMGDGLTLHRMLLTFSLSSFSFLFLLARPLLLSICFFPIPEPSHVNAPCCVLNLLLAIFEVLGGEQGGADWSLCWTHARVGKTRTYRTVLSGEELRRSPWGHRSAWEEPEPAWGYSQDPSDWENMVPPTPPKKPLPFLILSQCSFTPTVHYCSFSEEGFPSP